jgi:hypothetical protein
MDSKSFFTIALVMAITVLIMGNTNIFTSTSFAAGIVDHGQSGFAAACDLKGCITSHDNSGGQSSQDGNGLSLSCFAVLGVHTCTTTHPNSGGSQ